MFALAASEPTEGRHQRKSVTTCDFAVPSVLNGCARHTRKVAVATERRRWLEVTWRKRLDADQKNASGISIALRRRQQEERGCKIARCTRCTVE